MPQPIVTVFGGTGFLGREIAQAASRAGLQVRVASRHPPATVNGGKIHPVSADIQNEEAVSHAVEGAAAVVNAVSLYVEKGSATFDAIHVEGARRVARCAHRAGARTLVHVSGIGADAASPSAFVRARARGEQAVRQAFEPAIVIRPSVMFGHGDSFLSTLEKVTRLPVVPLFGQGETRLQPAYVADVAEAVSLLIKSGNSARRTFELGGTESYSYRQIVERVMTQLGRKRKLLPVPFAVWKSIAGVLALLPSPPLTRDQIILMEKDNVVSGREALFSDLGIAPRNLFSMLPYCLPGR